MTLSKRQKLFRTALLPLEKRVLALKSEEGNFGCFMRALGGSVLCTSLKRRTELAGTNCCIVHQSVDRFGQNKSKPQTIEMERDVNLICAICKCADEEEMRIYKDRVLFS
ncbi:hypothetical protein POTOM_041817 [Populus tomentosa]|uniref:Uncharacterized protein n=1 Tax=Populus tomentosa TaxID=118781 RepID=A0A8X8CH38_POPTO|nr:hypothetical protein POTOM_041817 [Populus tomentosa]